MNSFKCDNCPYMREMLKQLDNPPVRVIITKSSAVGWTQQIADVWNELAELDQKELISLAEIIPRPTFEPPELEPLSLQPEQSWQQMNRGKLSKKARRK